MMRSGPARQWPGRLTNDNEETSDVIPKALRRLHSVLPRGFSVPTLVHFGFGSDDARADLARQLASLNGYTAAEPSQARADATVPGRPATPPVRDRQPQPGGPE